MLTEAEQAAAVESVLSGLLRCYVCLELGATAVCRVRTNDPDLPPGSMHRDDHNDGLVDFVMCDECWKSWWNASTAWKDWKAERKRQVGR